MNNKLLKLVTLLFIVALTSCKEEGEKACTDAPYPWGINISTAQKFMQYKDVFYEDGEGMALYSTHYSTSSGRSYFKIQIDLNDICISDPPLVSGGYTVYIPDADIKDSLIITDLSNVNRFGITPSGSTYNLDYFYIFSGNTNNAGRLVVRNEVSFTSKGGWAADSIFFFENLAFFSATITSKVAPQ